MSGRKSNGEAGVTFRTNSMDADFVRNLAGGVYLSTDDLHKPTGVTDRLRKDHERFMAYKRTSLKRGISTILKEKDVKAAVEHASSEKVGESVLKILSLFLILLTIFLRKAIILLRGSCCRFN